MSENTPEHWDGVYSDLDDPPPWVIDKAQPEMETLISRGLIAGRLLDSGCGTGEHSLLARENGAEVLGVDISRNVIEIARRKAEDRGLDVEFSVVNMVELVPFEDGAFDTVLDSGVFHSFSGAEQRAYVDNLTRVTNPDGLLHLICFSEHQPGEGKWGPRRITQAEIRAAFAEGWSVDEIEPAVFRINEFRDTTHVKAWRALLRRVGQ
ncbi:MAG TPA: class I SAM-dependent methyltransferase [Actinomycetes bacterium]|nr:class I SAM-dependent methyltransferase [Actinomycetes bacterium]